MYESIMAQWVPNYLFTSIGLNARDQSIQISEYATLFEREFIDPVRKFTKSDNPSEKEIAVVVKTLNASKCKSWYRVLRVIADSYLIGIEGDLVKTVDNSITEFLTVSEPVYAMCAGGKTFTAYEVKGELVGTYTEKVCVLGYCSKFKKYVPEIRELIRKDPTTLPDYTLLAIRNAVEAGFVNDTALRSVMYPMPDYTTGCVINRYVKATDTDIPGFFVRKLISTLPEAFTKEKKSPYHAALEFAYTNPTEYRSAIAELEKIITALGDDTMQITPAEVERTSNGVDISGLTRENVTEWLHVTYGISYDNLANILIPTAEKTYSSPLLAGNLDEMSAKQLVDSMDENATGYLDEIVEAYLHEIGMSGDCTVNQLIESIKEGGVSKSPVSLFDQVADYVSAHDLPNELTIEEFCAQLPHTKETNIAAVMEALNESPMVPDSLCDMIAEALEGKSVFEGFDPKHETSEDDVITYLVRGGMPRATAANVVTSYQVPTFNLHDEMLSYLSSKGLSTDAAEYLYANGDLPESTYADKFDSMLNSKYSIGADQLDSVIADSTRSVDDSVKEYLQAVGYPEDRITAIMSGKDSTEHTLPSSVANNFGYIVGEQILRNTREALQKDDSWQKHDELRPVMACFMRLLLCGLQEKNDVREMLEKKESDAKGDAKRIIHDAALVLK